MLYVAPKPGIRGGAPGAPAAAPASAPPRAAFPRPLPPGGRAGRGQPSPARGRERRCRRRWLPHERATQYRGYPRRPRPPAAPPRRTLRRFHPARPPLARTWLRVREQTEEETMTL